VSVMFPGKADAAEYLYAVLGVLDRVVDGLSRRGRGGERVLVGDPVRLAWASGRGVRGAGGVPGQRRRTLEELAR